MLAVARVCEIKKLNLLQNVAQMKYNMVGEQRIKEGGD